MRVAEATDDGWRNAILPDTEHRTSSFGEDEVGELDLTDHGGAVYRTVEG